MDTLDLATKRQRSVDKTFRAIGGLFGMLFLAVIAIPAFIVMPFLDDVPEHWGILLVLFTLLVSGALAVTLLRLFTRLGWLKRLAVWLDARIKADIQ
jgi:hypothetical protein